MFWKISAASILLFVVIILMYAFSVRNRAIALNEDYKAREKTVQTAHDNMWKTISQKYEVAESYKDGFIKSIDAVVAGRTGGALMKTVQENMPGLSPDVYKDVMATIEGKRDMLKREMDEEVDVAREYNTLVETDNFFPVNMFMGPAAPIDAHIITSDQTNKAWDSGEDNNVSLRHPTTSN